MLKYISQRMDKTTLAVIASVFAISVFTLVTIDNMFVERIIIKDAQSLSQFVTEKINAELFPEQKSQDGFVNSHNIKTMKGNLYPASNTVQLPAFNWRPLVNAPKLNQFFDRYDKGNEFLNHLENYAVYMPSGIVYLPQAQLRSITDLKKYTSHKNILSSIQSVFENGRSLYAYRENEEGAYTQHFVPIHKSGKVFAIIMLEAVQTSAGVRISEAVSSAIYYTILSQLPILLLVMYLGWMRLKDKLMAQEKISFLAYNDQLTNLPNRLAFNKLLEEKITNSIDSEAIFAVFNVDIDDFDQINDAVGHRAGDQFLINIAKRLEEHSPVEATISRIAGDEFSIILPGVTTAGMAAQYASKYLELISQPFPGHGEEISCSSSIGIVFGPENGQDAETLVKNAKMALACAKQDGGNSFRFFEPNMDEALQKRRQLEKSLSLAIKREEFEIYYQPQVELSGANVIGYEALLRWNHPEKGMVSPADFIPILEETRMIVEVGEYVLRRACKEALTWQNNAKVAVNLSVVQFEYQDVVSMVARALKDSGLPAERLEIEITESILMNDSKAAVNILDDLKQLGIKIAMDDFGTGYSSLSYISDFDFDKIKIDQSFVSSIQTDERARAIITTIIGLGRALDIMITAEGIETNEQLLLIQAAGCHFGQGYLFGRPVPLSETLQIEKEEAEDNVEYLREKNKSQVA